MKQLTTTAGFHIAYFSENATIVGIIDWIKSNPPILERWKGLHAMVTNELPLSIKYIDAVDKTLYEGVFVMENKFDRSELYLETINVEF